MINPVIALANSVMSESSFYQSKRIKAAKVLLSAVIFVNRLEAEAFIFPGSYRFPRSVELKLQD